MNKNYIYILLIAVIFFSCSVVNKNYPQRFGSGKRGAWKTTNNRAQSKNRKSSKPRKGKTIGKRNYKVTKVVKNKKKKLSTQDYIDLYHKIAVKEMNYSGIPASITLAQGIVESGSGNSTLAKKSNNHFGIKCHKSWVGEKVYHDDDASQECFRKYKDPYDSYRDHTDFLAYGYRYQFLFDYELTDYESWARGLKKAGYATAPNYAETLISIIEKYELYKYTNEFYNKKSVKIQRPKVKIKEKKIVKVVELKPLDIKNENGRKYIIIGSGDTFFSLSRRSKISVDSIKKFNNMTSTTLHLNQKLYLEPEIEKQVVKPNKTENVEVVKEVTHVVVEGETLYSISKKYSVSLDSLYSENNIDKDASIKIGQELIIPEP